MTNPLNGKTPQDVRMVDDPTRMSPIDNKPEKMWVSELPVECPICGKKAKILLKSECSDRQPEVPPEVILAPKNLVWEQKFPAGWISVGVDPTKNYPIMLYNLTAQGIPFHIAMEIYMSTEFKKWMNPCCCAKCAKKQAVLLIDEAVEALKFYEGESKKE